MCACVPPLCPAVTKHRNTTGIRVLEVVPSSPVLRRSSEPQLSPSSSTDAALQEPAPGGHPPTVHSYLSDAAGGSHCEPHPSPAPPPKSYVERLRVEEGRTTQPGKEEGGEPFTAPLVETVSSFNPSKYHSALMGAENKPLEMGILKRVKELLGEADAKTAAKHITKADCTVGRCPAAFRRAGPLPEQASMLGSHDRLTISKDDIITTDFTPRRTEEIQQDKLYIRNRNCTERRL